MIERGQKFEQIVDNFKEFKTETVKKKYHNMVKQLLENPNSGEAERLLDALNILNPGAAPPLIKKEEDTTIENETPTERKQEKFEEYTNRMIDEEHLGVYWFCSAELKYLYLYVFKFNENVKFKFRYISNTNLEIDIFHHLSKDDYEQFAKLGSYPVTISEVNIRPFKKTIVIKSPIPFLDNPTVEHEQNSNDILQEISFDITLYNRNRNLKQ